MTITYYLKGRQENVLKTCKKILDNEIMVEMVERIKEISTQGKMIHNYSRFTWLHHLKRKSNFFFVYFHKFQLFIKNQFIRRTKVFQCDCEKEFSSNIFLEHLQNDGI